MRRAQACIAFLALPVMILGNTARVPRDYPLLQSAITASGANDTIVCDTVNDFDTLKIIGKTGLVLTGPSASPLTRITKVLLVSKSTCMLSLLSFAAAKGINGNNNNSCRNVPAMDGKDGADAIIADSSTISIVGCSLRGGDGGSYGASYQGTMLCSCGSKGAPGSALRAGGSTILLANDSLLSGNCSSISLAGCFTNNCSVLGYGCWAQDRSAVDTMSVVINSVNLDSTYSWDVAGRMTAQGWTLNSNGSTWVTGSTYRQQFDNMGRLYGVTRDATGGPVTIATSALYGPANELIGLSYLGYNEARLYINLL